MAAWLREARDTVRLACQRGAVIRREAMWFDRAADEAREQGDLIGASVLYRVAATGYGHAAAVHRAKAAVSFWLAQALAGVAVVGLVASVVFS